VPGGSRTRGSMRLPTLVCSGFARAKDSGRGTDAPRGSVESVGNTEQPASAIASTAYMHTQNRETASDAGLPRARHPGFSMIGSASLTPARVPESQRFIAWQNPDPLHRARLDEGSDLAAALAEAAEATRSRLRLRRRAADLPDSRAHWERRVFAVVWRRANLFVCSFLAPVAPAHASRSRTSLRCSSCPLPGSCLS
jgi:hypothetical protein